MSGGGARSLEGIGRSLGRVEGEGLPTAGPIDRRRTPPPPPAVVGFRGECRDGGDKLRGGGRRRGNDRRLARWSLHRSGSHIFSSPTALLLQPLLPIVGSFFFFFFSCLFFYRRLPPRFVSMFLIFRTPSPTSYSCKPPPPSQTRC